MEISNILSLSYQTPAAFNLKDLCILPYKKCWKMFVDILVRAVYIYIYIIIFVIHMRKFEYLHRYYNVEATFLTL